MTSFGAQWVCPVSAPPIEDGVVLVEDGRVVQVRRRTGAPDLDYPGCALIPGFVNAHIHLELTVLRGFLENLAFPEWIRRLTRTKYAVLDRDDLEVSARLGVIECLRAGVTTVGEVMDIGTGWTAMRALGLNGVAYQEVFGPDPAQSAAALDGLGRKMAALEAGQTSTQRIGVSPHAPFTVSDDLYRGVGRLARERGVRIAVHIAESADEVAFVRDGTGPFAENWRRRNIPVIARGQSPVAYLDELGLLGPETLAIHAIECDAADVARIAMRDAPVVHCPKSNMKLGHRIAPVSECIDAGVSVALGTDSVASNNTVDMFEEMRTAIFLQRSATGNPRRLSGADALRMATIDGARALGLDAEVGSIAPGKRADFALVRLSEPSAQPVYDPVDALVFSACRADVESTILAGQSASTDAADTRERAREIAVRIRNTFVNS